MNARREEGQSTGNLAERRGLIRKAPMLAQSHRACARVGSAQRRFSFGGLLRWFLIDVSTENGIVFLAGGEASQAAIDLIPGGAYAVPAMRRILAGERALPEEDQARCAQLHGTLHGISTPSCTDSRGWHGACRNPARAQRRPATRARWSRRSRPRGRRMPRAEAREEIRERWFSWCCSLVGEMLRLEAVLRGKLDAVQPAVVAADYRALGVDDLGADVHGRDRAPDQVQVLRAIRLVDARRGAGGRRRIGGGVLDRASQLRRPEVPVSDVAACLLGERELAARVQVTVGEKRANLIAPDGVTGVQVEAHVVSRAERHDTGECEGAAPASAVRAECRRVDMDVAR